MTNPDAPALPPQPEMKLNYPTLKYTVADKPCACSNCAGSVPVDGQVYRGIQPDTWRCLNCGPVAPALPAVEALKQMPLQTYEMQWKSHYRDSEMVECGTSGEWCKVADVQKLLEAAAVAIEDARERLDRAIEQVPGNGEHRRLLLSIDTILRKIKHSIGCPNTGLERYQK